MILAQVRVKCVVGGGGRCLLASLSAVNHGDFETPVRYRIQAPSSTLARGGREQQARMFPANTCPRYLRSFPSLKARPAYRWSSDASGRLPLFRKWLRSGRMKPSPILRQVISALPGDHLSFRRGCVGGASRTRSGRLSRIGRFAIPRSCGQQRPNGRSGGGFRDSPRSVRHEIHIAIPLMQYRGEGRREGRPSNTCLNGVWLPAVAP